MWSVCKPISALNRIERSRSLIQEWTGFLYIILRIFIFFIFVIFSFFFNFFILVLFYAFVFFMLGQTVNTSFSQRIDQLLNKEEGGDGGELRSLNEDLTIEKIAALKKKRINHQKKNIASTAVDEWVALIYFPFVFMKLFSFRWINIKHPIQHYDVGKNRK